MQWVIELVDKSRFAIPLSWAEPVNNLDQGDLNTTAGGPLADAKTYLDLAKMIDRIKMNQPEEVQPHETSSLYAPVVSAKNAIGDGRELCNTAGMGQIAPISTARNDIDVSQHAGQTTSNHSAKKRGA